MTDRMTPTEYREAVTLTWTEQELQNHVIALAQELGWMVHHCRKAMRSDGEYRTPIQGDKGFPDLVMARDGVVLFIECKAEGGSVTSEQQQWIRTLLPRRPSSRVFVRVWRPSDWVNGVIAGVLT